jgi:hypothetical protein
MNGLVTPDRRIRLASEAAQAAASPELEAVFLGHATAANFAAAGAPRAAAAALGFTPADGDQSLTGLPLAFTDPGTFAAVFPNDESWLAGAVNDYFAAGGQRAWVVRVPVDPDSPLDAYFGAGPSVSSYAPQSAIGIAAQVFMAGLLLLPDLEHACLASSSPPPSMPPPPPIQSVFRPLDDFLEPPPPSGSSSAPQAPVAPFDVLSRVSAALGRLRQDMMCLFTLPLGADDTLSQAAIVKRAQIYLRGVNAATGDAAPVNPGKRILGGTDLPQVQTFAPLTADAAGNMKTPVGIIAGLLSAVAETDGVWRSVAGRTLPLGVTPLRRIESNAVAELRAAGIVVLRFIQNGTFLDDDIMACQQNLPGSALRRSAGWQRLMGWLVRNLTSFGERLVFENLNDDARVDLVLMGLFQQLFQRGALSGGQVTDAVQIIHRPQQEPNQYVCWIKINAAVAVETIRLQFIDGSLTTTLGAAT